MGTAQPSIIALVVGVEGAYVRMLRFFAELCNTHACCAETHDTHYYELLEILLGPTNPSNASLCLNITLSMESSNACTLA